MKGSSIIQLTDVRNGNVKEYKDTNMLTNGLSNFLSTNFGTQAEMKNETFNNSEDFFGNLFNGVLVYADTIEENVNNVFPPSGNKLVGHAGSTAYNGIDKLRGNLNTTESYINDTEAKLVFDFATTQANGIISALALTQGFFGNLGYGGDLVGGTDYIDSFASEYDVTKTITSKFTKRILTTCNDTHFYCIDYTNTNKEDFKLFKKEINLIDFNLSMFNMKELTEEDFETITFPESVKTDLGNSSYDIINAGFRLGDPCLMFRRKDVTYIPAGGSFSVWLYFLKSNTWEKRTMINHHTSSMTYSYFYTMHDFYYSTAHTHPQKLYFYDGTNIDVPTEVGTMSYVLMRNDSMIFTSSRMFDYVTNQVFQINNVQSDFTWPIQSFYPTQYGIVTSNQRTSAPFDIKVNLYKSLPLLWTINNLDEIITKTENQTMKIIYTLTN